MLHFQSQLWTYVRACSSVHWERESPSVCVCVCLQTGSACCTIWPRLSLLLLLPHRRLLPLFIFIFFYLTPNHVEPLKLLRQYILNYGAVRNPHKHGACYYGPHSSQVFTPLPCFLSESVRDFHSVSVCFSVFIEVIFIAFHSRISEMQVN